MAEYVPFGEEWKKEMKKLNKDELIDFLKKTLIEKKNIKNSGLADCYTEAKTDNKDDADLLAEAIKILTDFRALIKGADVFGCAADLSEEEQKQWYVMRDKTVLNNELFLDKAT
jgi:hypothetical protein